MMMMMWLISLVSRSSLARMVKGTGISTGTSTASLRPECRGEDDSRGV